MGRLQKERDEAKSEIKDLHDRIEIQQTQLLKTQREKEILHTELEVYKERMEKLQSSVQKIHVSLPYFQLTNVQNTFKFNFPSKKTRNTNIFI